MAWRDWQAEWHEAASAEDDLSSLIRRNVVAREFAEANGWDEHESHEAENNRAQEEYYGHADADDDDEEGEMTPHQYRMLQDASGNDDYAMADAAHMATLFEDDDDDDDDELLSDEDRQGIFDTEMSAWSNEHVAAQYI